MTAQALMPTVDFPVKARKHRWDYDNEKRIPASESPDKNGRTERTCLLCRMVKITVHVPRGYPEREWRTAAGDVWRGDATPPCLDLVMP